MWTNGEHASCVKRMDLCSTNIRLPRVAEPFAPLTKDGMVRCLAFWQLGESQTLYKKSGHVCVPDMNLVRWNMKSSHNWTWICIFSFQSVVYVGGISFCLGIWSLWAVFSKSPSYMVSLLRQFHFRWETVSPIVLKYLFIDMHIPVIVEA